MRQESAKSNIILGPTQLGEVGSEHFSLCALTGLTLLSCVLQPIFTMSAQQNQLKDITEVEFLEFMNSYNYIPVSFHSKHIACTKLHRTMHITSSTMQEIPLFQSAMQFLEAYTAEDVTVAELEGSSNSLWTISPPSRKNLMEVLNKEDQFPVTMSWTVQR